MYGIYAYIWVSGVNVGIYSMHGVFGIWIMNACSYIGRRDSTWKSPSQPGEDRQSGVLFSI